MILQGRYVVSRVLQTILTLLVVLTLMFFLFRLVPGDPTAMYVSGRLAPEEIEAIREAWGLNDPIYIQYFRYVGNLLKGNLGRSFFYRDDVVAIITPRIFNTLILMGPAMLATVVLGIMAGSYLGWKHGSKTEKAGVIFSLLARSFPVFVSGVFAMMFLSFYLDLFPLGGMRTVEAKGLTWWQEFLDVAHHMALPFVVTILYNVGDVLMIARTSIIELIGEEFLSFARARGLSPSKIRRIAVRNAIIPVLTYSTIMIGFAFGGQVLVEVVFSWPGVGRLMVDSVTRHDYPVAQATFFLMAMVVIVLNLVMDLIYVYLDPRIASEDSTRR
ncbi:MAG: ABC transporter permease [Deltaproteobacteria bacterium]|nr:ABC transporter permease [Deltaproteobacteria bacterium]